MTKRREFIKKTALGSAGVTIGAMAFSAKSYGSIIGSNDRIHLAQIGIRNQGTVHIDNYCNIKDSHNVTLNVLCDTDENLFDAKAKIVSEKTGVKPKLEWDLRKVLDNEEIDAVSIATPNHWHALASIWAMQAGKHVYVEKPASHNIWEGRKMIQAAQKTGLTVQVGLTNRSYNNVREAIQFLHEGGIGKVYMARALTFKLRNSYGTAENSRPPEGFHYDQWLGPALYRPYNDKRSHYNWHWYWDTGNGDSGNTGTHQLDIARWGLQKNEHPETIYSMGGIYGFNLDDCLPENCTPGTRVYGDVNTYGHDKSAQETPNIQTGLFKYVDGTMLEYEARGRYTNHEGSGGQEVGNLFYGEDGWLEISGNSWRAFHHRETQPFASSKANGEQTATLYSNFIETIRSGDHKMLQCDMHEGFYSTALPLLANISYRVKRELKFMGDYERFANDSEADTMLSRIYREPYVVPDKV
ncbi:Gfo/Idh/MocA family protein [Cyclobacterium marinum]|uniref:Oxidoreductase domain protein n=1 Tax=Cyclobacterium marinum (strain ATCC 25205 / DSM 745 / LMG 13164 / NCIMB 1802) TaxID=880070 RepID=G0J2Y8_CYCMS|nr:Gfo/Idh/MocA family oxidoreductase [Cyclobacterium marinum]AEL27475.1 oxidoreductase domain protein [Cyclobacterium marinum DSM 745]